MRSGWPNRVAPIDDGDQRGGQLLQDALAPGPLVHQVGDVLGHHENPADIVPAVRQRDVLGLQDLLRAVISQGLYLDHCGPAVTGLAIVFVQQLGADRSDDRRHGLAEHLLGADARAGCRLPVGEGVPALRIDRGDGRRLTVGDDPHEGE